MSILIKHQRFNLSHKPPYTPCRQVRKECDAPGKTFRNFDCLEGGTDYLLTDDIIDNDLLMLSQFPICRNQCADMVAKYVFTSLPDSAMSVPPIPKRWQSKGFYGGTKHNGYGLFSYSLGVIILDS